MHGLFKKHYYDVMKSGQEDTILESDTSNQDCDYIPTSEVGCNARVHLKSNLVQTFWNRNNKNFRNECTVTSDEDSGAVTLDCPINNGFPVHDRRTYKDVAIMGSSEATEPSNQQHPLLKPGKTTVVERAVECVDFFQNPIKIFAPVSTITMTAKCDDECTQCHLQSKMRISDCDKYQYIPSHRGLAACRTFSLGSPESRRLLKEHCNTKLIGGCRVPVSKNYKNRF